MYDNTIYLHQILALPWRECGFKLLEQRHDIIYKLAIP